MDRVEVIISSKSQRPCKITKNFWSNYPQKQRRYKTINNGYQKKIIGKHMVKWNSRKKPSWFALTRLNMKAYYSLKGLFKDLSYNLTHFEKNRKNYCESPVQPNNLAVVASGPKEHSVQNYMLYWKSFKKPDVEHKWKNLIPFSGS